MRRRQFLAAVALMPAAVRAQAPAPRRVGYLGSSRELDVSAGLAATFTAEMKSLGWVEGRDVVYDFRWSRLANDELPRLAAEMVRANADVIVVTAGATGTRAARAASTTTPIVMATVADPVKFGLIESFAHPGGNVTGVALPLVDWGKWIELAKEALPHATRFAVVGNRTSIVYPDYVAQNETAARRLGVNLVMCPVARVEDFAGAFATIRSERANAVILGPDALLVANMPALIAMANADRVPVIAATRRDAELGATIAYGADFNYMMRRAAAYTDKVLRGAKPADLPVDQPSRFELILNLRAAKSLGIALPRTLLVRADQLIE